VDVSAPLVSFFVDQRAELALGVPIS
jgi:hypothetical protein